MLGDKLGEEEGKITGMRVISVKNGIPQVEITFQSRGKLLGIEFNNLGTFLSIPWPSRVLHGEGKGFLTTKDGEVATWSGEGVGRPGPSGAASWRGSLHLLTQSQKLARLNSIRARVYDFLPKKNFAS
jgi:hypothetical protein